MSKLSILVFTAVLIPLALWVAFSGGMLEAHNLKNLAKPRADGVAVSQQKPGISSIRGGNPLQDSAQTQIMIPENVMPNSVSNQDDGEDLDADGSDMSTLNASAIPPDFADLEVEISFLGIGAQGAGTTWLAEMLMDCCPSVAFGVNKELHFWDWNREKGLDWYSDQVYPNRTSTTDAAIFRGEITPHYMSLPENDIAEIRALFPEVRIIFIARDLVDRAWSQLRKKLRLKYLHGHLPTLDPANYTDDYFSRLVGRQEFTERSNYDEYITKWYKHFPEDQILILNFDDIAKEPEHVLQQVLEHIGVKDGDSYLQQIEGEEEKTVNPGAKSDLSPNLRKVLEDRLRPHAQAFNEILREHGYAWTLDDYTP